MPQYYRPSLLLAKINSYSSLNLITDYLWIHELKFMALEWIKGSYYFKSEFHFYFQLPRRNPTAYITIKLVI